MAFMSVLHPIWFVILLRLNINQLLFIRLPCWKFHPGYFCSTNKSLWSPQS
jgi:hypothetical protein